MVKAQVEIVLHYVDLIGKRGSLNRIVWSITAWHPSLTISNAQLATYHVLLWNFRMLSSRTVTTLNNFKNFSLTLTPNFFFFLFGKAIFFYIINQLFLVASLYVKCVHTLLKTMGWLQFKEMY